MVGNVMQVFVTKTFICCCSPCRSHCMVYICTYAYVCM